MLQRRLDRSRQTIRQRQVRNNLSTVAAQNLNRVPIGVQSGP